MPVPRLITEALHSLQMRSCLPIAANDFVQQRQVLMTIFTSGNPASFFFRLILMSSSKSAMVKILSLGVGRKNNSLDYTQYFLKNQPPTEKF